ncbi:hypothetical protein LTR37_004649 [Vermiconidia calcicola]|uniref:Uncharacterized protein n=1 Tax=Vermiconidia calcicola TaxID=1690605 RepID=A0ACC3NLK3_9PEZI|nr:hypothetical protein LTR37_004649 [Vermiconidia calcicola]
MMDKLLTRVAHIAVLDLEVEAKDAEIQANRAAQFRCQTALEEACKALTAKQAENEALPQEFKEQQSKEFSEQNEGEGVPVKVKQ